MRTVSPLVLPLTLVLAAACGKVGDPKPPIIRIPQPVADLSASQTGYRVILSWTNPAKYVDDNAATDLGMVHILRNGVEISVVSATGAGQPQSFELDVAGEVGATSTFSLRLEVPRVRGVSPISNTASIQVVDVPGSPRNLVSVVDGFRILLEWQAPERNGQLADVYIVQRSDRPAAEVVSGTRFADAEFEPGKTYDYTVTAARGAQGQVRGLAGPTVSVVSTDKTPPVTPSGLVVQSLGAQVILRWRANTERDFKDVLVFRSDRVEPIAATPVDGYVDSGYRPGLAYQLAARDVFDNLSPRSAPQSGP